MGAFVASLCIFTGQGIGELKGDFVWTPAQNSEGFYDINFEGRSGFYDEVPVYGTLHLQVVPNQLPPTNIGIIGRASVDENSRDGVKIVSFFTEDENQDDVHT